MLIGTGAPCYKREHGSRAEVFARSSLPPCFCCWSNRSRCPCWPGSLEGLRFFTGADAGYAAYAGVVAAGLGCEGGQTVSRSAADGKCRSHAVGGSALCRVSAVWHGVERHWARPWAGFVGADCSF